MEKPNAVAGAFVRDDRAPLLTLLPWGIFTCTWVLWIILLVPALPRGVFLCFTSLISSLAWGIFRLTWVFGRIFHLRDGERWRPS